jgi:hypothetical protein
MDTEQQTEQGAWTSLWHFVKSLPAGGRIKRAAAAIWMNILVGAVVVIAAFLTGLPAAASQAANPSWSIRAVTVFAIWLLSFVPGWLYIRFLGLRADALWNEYVLNLYRLGLDQPKWLPPPPAESAYGQLPGARDGGDEKSNINRQKINAYYGRKVSARSRNSEDFRVSVDTLFPVFLCTVTLTVAWTVILWDPAVLMSPLEPWATLEFGFLGAYAFAVSTLVRRFYQSDLRPSAYAAVVLRIVVVLLILAVMHQMFAIGSDGAVAHASQYVTAFVVGFFPLAGLQALQRVASKVLQIVLPRIAPDYPLDQLDGLNIWYEARLAEEGVEDMQNLTTMNLVDVILHTRAPVGRLIDWIDQAFLLIHLDPASPAENDSVPGACRDKIECGISTRLALRRIGVRSATDLLRAFGTGEGHQGSPHQAPSTDAFRVLGLEPHQIEMLLRLLADEPGLDPVWNWKAGGAGRRATPAPVSGNAGAILTGERSSYQAWSGLQPDRLR